MFGLVIDNPKTFFVIWSVAFTIDLKINKMAPSVGFVMLAITNFDIATLMKVDRAYQKPSREKATDWITKNVLENILTVVLYTN